MVGGFCLRLTAGTNKLHKIINRNTITNVKQMIMNHNKHLLQGYSNKKETPNNVKLCNCREKASCPLNSKCLAKCVIYKVTVTETTTKNQESYIGLTDNEFKTRYNRHKSPSKLMHRKKDTKLSEHIWELKDRNIKHTIQWEIIKKVRLYTPEKSVCKLCLEEKYQI